MWNSSGLETWPTTHHTAPQVLRPESTADCSWKWPKTIGKNQRSTKSTLFLINYNYWLHIIMIIIVYEMEMAKTKNEREIVEVKFERDNECRSWRRFAQWWAMPWWSCGLTYLVLIALRSLAFEFWFVRIRRCPFENFDCRFRDDHALREDGSGVDRFRMKLSIR